MRQYRHCWSYFAFYLHEGVDEDTFHSTTNIFYISHQLRLIFATARSLHDIYMFLWCNQTNCCICSRDDHGAGVDSGQSLHFGLEQKPESIF